MEITYIFRLLKSFKLTSEVGLAKEVKNIPDPSSLSRVNLWFSISRVQHVESGA